MYNLTKMSAYNAVHSSSLISMKNQSNVHPSLKIWQAFTEMGLAPILSTSQISFNKLCIRMAAE